MTTATNADYLAGAAGLFARLPKPPRAYRRSFRGNKAVFIPGRWAVQSGVLTQPEMDEIDQTIYLYLRAANYADIRTRRPTFPIPAFGHSTRKASA